MAPLNMIPNLSLLSIGGNPGNPGNPGKRMRLDDSDGDMDVEIINWTRRRLSNRLWGILYENQQVSFNSDGVRDYSLPTRDEIKTLFRNRHEGLKQTCSSETAIKDIEKTLKGNKALVYVVDIVDGRRIMVGAIALGRHRGKDSHTTLSPSQWLDAVRDDAKTNKLRNYDRMDPVTGQVTWDDRWYVVNEYEAGVDAHLIGENHKRMDDRNPKATFYFEWVCSANSSKDARTTQNNEYVPEKGIGELLVNGMARYIDQVYVQPCVDAAERELWPGIVMGDPTTLRQRVTEWVRRRTFFTLVSLISARGFWEDVMGFQQLGKHYYFRDSTCELGRLVYPSMPGLLTATPGNRGQQKPLLYAPFPKLKNPPEGVVETETDVTRRQFSMLIRGGE